LEGSTLGGQVIAKLLRQSSLINPPLTFFAGYGDQTDQMWNEFIRFAEINCTVDHQDGAVQSALELFEAIKAHNQSAP
jgi:heme oxygenase